MCNNTWFVESQQGSKLVGTGGISAAQGYSVSLSADGNTLAIGGPEDNSIQGAVWIWTRNMDSGASKWIQQGSKLIGSGNTGEAYQGNSVSLSADGNTLAVGGPADDGNQGAVWIWIRTGGMWSQQGSKLFVVSSLARQGSSVSLSADGNTLAVGGPGDNTNQGAVWIWTHTGGVWTQQGSKLVGTGNTGAAYQGYSASLSANGNTLAFGGISDDANQGAVWIFT